MTTLTLEKRDGIAIVSMNCPDQPQNVLSEDFRNEYESVFADIANDSALKGMISLHQKGLFLGWRRH